MVFTLGELLNTMTQANQLKHHQESNPDNAELLLVYEAPAAAGTAAAAVGSSMTPDMPNALMSIEGVGRRQWTVDSGSEKHPVYRRSTGGKKPSLVHMYAKPL